MNRYAIQGPKVIWKASLVNSLSTRMEMFRAIVTEDEANKNSDEYDCDPDSLFKNNEALDYAVVKIKGNAGMKWGCLKLKPIDVKVNDKVNIIQHPAGGPKQIAMNDNEVKYVDETVVQYITDTLPGSSGSPVFNDNWQVIALHHSGGSIPEPSTNSIHFRNEGIRIGAVIKDIPTL